MTVTWFRHSHENRNDLLRYGLMRLHYKDEINYVELPFADIGRFGFSNRVTELKDPRHVSFLLVQHGKQKIRCLVDSEDSFALFSPFISEVDLVFCSGYNSDLFERKQFVRAYAWQTKKDVEIYEKMLEEKINSLGQYFNRVKKFIPIAPNQGIPLQNKFWKQKYNNISYRVGRTIGGGVDFSEVYWGFETRENYLNSLRTNQLQYDIVLNDSLWGWPQHRINLHKRLQEHHENGYQIHSILNWLPSGEHSVEYLKDFDASSFPMSTLKIHESYELMLSKSRLAVFACGFHWGWRNIMMFALRTGIPVFTDRLLTEAYFDMNEFVLFQHEDTYWKQLETTLKDINPQTWLRHKEQNQRVYDRYMSPESVANYFLQTNELNLFSHEYSSKSQSY